MGIFCILQTGCVSEQWVRGYVQHELAGVKDVVTEEVYPLEKAVIDVRTQMATVIVELKEVKDGLQAIERSMPADDKKWDEVGQRVNALETGLKKLEGLVGDLEKFRSSLVWIQTDTETIKKGQEPVQKPLMERSKLLNKGREK